MDKGSNKTLEQTLSEINERNSSIQSDRKSATCKICQREFGVYEADKKSKDMCPDCEYRKEIKQRMIKHTLENEIPKKYQDIDSDHNEMFNDLENISLFLTGGSGTGKTVFACSLAKRYIKKGRELKFISFPAFIMELQSSFKKDKNNENAFEIAESVAKFRGALIIDDLGAEKLTEFVRQIIYFIINEREQRCLTTIITSNFSLSELDDHIDSRISSRISGMCNVIKLTGKDRRLDK